MDIINVIVSHRAESYQRISKKKMDSMYFIQTIYKRIRFNKVSDKNYE